MNTYSRIKGRCAPGTLSALAIALALAACGGSSSTGEPLPAAITQVMNQPMYDGATWSLRVVDLASGQVIYDLDSNDQLLIGSVRKLFSVGAALNQLGTQHQFVTPVYKQGSVDASGTLNGNLFIVANGDLSMGGRTNPDGTLAITNLDHNEADSIGNAELTAPDPLAGYDSLAAQVAAAGIKRINGEVVVDDRLFVPFYFRDQFNVTPMFVNDDVVDVIISQGSEAAATPLTWRPMSAAFGVQSTLTTGSNGSPLTLELTPEVPTCIGSTGCTGTVSGNVAADFVPPLTNAYPLIRTFRITEPSTYARTVFVEALQRAGVTVSAATVEANPVQLLPAQGSYSSSAQVAQLVSQTYDQYAKWILKVSYNIGADTSLMLFGLADNGSTTMTEALAAEQTTLSTQFGVPVSQVHFIDGSGGGDTSATAIAVVAMLNGMSSKTVYPSFVSALPILAVDGSLSFVTDFESNPSLAGAAGRVYAKTGTFVAAATAPATGLVLKGQALAGYIDAQSGRRLMFSLTVNNVPLTSFNDILTVFQDEGTIAATIWSLQ
jgi:D-alanyl-D-alanine carboxypeptidase